MSFQQISLDRFSGTFATFIGMYDRQYRCFKSKLMPYAELSSIALGGQIVSVSDDFFAEAFHLLLVEVRLMSMLQLRKANATY
jgi:allantoicase